MHSPILIFTITLLAHGLLIGAVYGLATAGLSIVIQILARKRKLPLTAAILPIRRAVLGAFLGLAGQLLFSLLNRVMPAQQARAISWTVTGSLLGLAAARTIHYVSAPRAFFGTFIASIIGAFLFSGDAEQLARALMFLLLAAAVGGALDMPVRDPEPDPFGRPLNPPIPSVIRYAPVHVTVEPRTARQTLPK